jgi:hypothetical protein
MAGQIVDTESAREFMREARSKISTEEMEAIAGELAEKSRRFGALLAADRVDRLGEAELRAIFRSIFSTRRSVAKLFGGTPPEELRGRLGDLLHGPEPVATRFERFAAGLGGIEATARFDATSELLHYARPEEHWLWTRWMWNPENDTGALRLVTMDGYDLRGGSVGETYLRVGEAVAFVSETARAVGFQSPATGLFGTTVYLALVYVIYVYTTLRMRMTQEFNRVVPELPELSRRILGVYRMEV